MSTSNFVFKNENHTLGNLLKHQLLKNEFVKFAGYKFSHSPEEITFTIQTSEEITPEESLIETITKLLIEFSSWEENFLKSLKEIRKGSTN